MIIYENRASAILFNTLLSHNDDRPYLVPANVCPIVCLTFMAAGKRFEFVDISSETLCMDEQKVCELLSRKGRRYAGVLYVRTYGVERTVEPFFQSLKKIDSELLIVDDRCLCVPDFDSCAEGGADLLLYSTGYAKYVDVGFGGFAHFNERVEYRRTEGSFSPGALSALTKEYKQAIQLRYRFSCASSDWLDRRLPELSFAEYKEKVLSEFYHAQRRKNQINGIYYDRIPDQIQFPSEYQNWRFNVRVRDKNVLLDKIFSHGLFASSHYASLAGIFSDGTAPTADKLHRQVINLFNDRRFSVEQAERVCDIVCDYVRNRENCGRNQI